MLEMPMMPSAAKAHRNDKSPSPEAAKTNDGDLSEADFDAAYASDAEADAKTSPDAAAGKEVSAEVAEDAAKLPTSDPDDTDGLAAFETEPDADADVPERKAEGEPGEAATAEKPAPKTRTDTSELAFAQRVLREESAVQAKTPEATATTSTGKADQAHVSKTLPGQAAQPVEKAAAVPVATVKEVKTAVATQANAAQNTTPAVFAGAVAETVDAAEQIALPAAKRTKSEEIRRRPAPDSPAAPAPKVKTAAAAAQMTVQNATPQAGMPLAMQAEAASLDVPLSALGEIDAPSSWDPRSTAPATLAQTLSRPETPGMIGRQMAEMLQRFPDRPVEVSLNPEELGRVRMSISAAEGGITVHVLAERPETLDLMRRHIDQLAREFQALGYENISFAFNEGQSDTNAGSDDESNGQSGTRADLTDLSAEPAVPVQLAASSGVDLRL